MSLRAKTPSSRPPSELSVQCKHVAFCRISSHPCRKSVAFCRTPHASTPHPKNRLSHLSQITYNPMMLAPNATKCDIPRKLPASPNRKSQI